MTDLAAVAAALCPTGPLRVALNEANFLLVPAPAAEGRGVAADLGRALGERLGRPVAFIGYADAGKVADAAARRVGRGIHRRRPRAKRRPVLPGLHRD